MSAPEAVDRKTIQTPRPRMQNVPLDIVPDALESFEHHDGYSVAVALESRYLSVWGFPWWTGDPVSAPVSGSFSTAFSSAFDGGVDSPTGTAFGRAFSSAFS